MGGSESKNKTKKSKKDDDDQVGEEYSEIELRIMEEMINS